MRRRLLLSASLLLCGCGNDGASFPELYQQPDPTIVMMGDSITYRWAFANPSILQLEPTANDAGISGNTTAAMLARFATDVIAYKPQTVVILGGTNDIIVGATDISNLAAMASDATQAGEHVILCTIPPSPMLDPSLVQAWNGEVTALAQSQGYGLANYAAAAWTDAMFDGDREHPNNLGYAAMWPILHTQL